MKKIQMTLAATFLLISIHAVWAGEAVRKVAAEGVYGWDISCKGTKALRVHAYQSDDDFYIDYEGVSVPKTSVWANNADSSDSSLKTLKFHTDQAVSAGPNVSLEVDREKAPGFGYASGTITIEGNSRSLNCYVRYGMTETDFDKISGKPFPKIKAPKN